MPVNWNDFMEFLRGFEQLQGRYPAPGAPQFPEYQGLKPEEESGILESIKRYVGDQTRENLGDVRQDAASRGAYRSGQLPALEQKTREAGTRSYSDALARYFTGKAGRLQSWNQQRTGFDMDRWKTQFGSYQQGMQGLGSTYGKFFRPRGN